MPLTIPQKDQFSSAFQQLLEPEALAAFVTQWRTDPQQALANLGLSEQAATAFNQYVVGVIEQLPSQYPPGMWGDPIIPDELIENPPFQLLPQFNDPIYERFQGGQPDMGDNENLGGPSLDLEDLDGPSIDGSKI